MTFLRLLNLLLGAEPSISPPPLLEETGTRPKKSGADPLASSPRVTVITVALNAVSDLKKTLASVQRQTYPNLEYIVIDGGSSDGSAELLRQSGRVDYWVSEPDEGISDAFNKGVRASSGEWINFLNAGDVFAHPDTISHMVEKGASADIVTGYVTYGSNTIPNRQMSNADPLHRRAWISHQGSFVRRQVFSAVGMFRPEFRVRMDYDFWLRALRGRDFIFTDEIVGHYSAGLSERSIDRFYIEELVANRINLGRRWLRDILVVYSYLGRVYRKMRDGFRNV